MEDKEMFLGRIGNQGHFLNAATGELSTRRIGDGYKTEYNIDPEIITWHCPRDYWKKQTRFNKKKLLI